MRNQKPWRLAGNAGFFLALLFCAGAQAQQKPFVVEGTLRGADGKTITLIRADNNRKTDAYIIRNEHFVLKGEADSLSVFALSLEGGPYPLLVVTNGGDTVHVNGEGSSFPVAAVTGNTQTVLMQEYQKQFSPLMQQAQKINAAAATLNEDDSAAVARLQQQANVFNAQMRSIGVAFVQYHPEALASVFVLMNEIHNISPDQLQMLMGSLTDNVKRSRFWQLAENTIRMTAATAIGSEAPAFSLDDVSGKPVSLASFRGKYVLVDFWASWCGPCRAENPNVVKAFRKYRNRNFTILGVSLDNSKKSWINAIRQDGLSWTQVSDLQGWSNSVAKLYHVNSIPSNFLIDPSGKIIAKNLRGSALENTLAQVLK